MVNACADPDFFVREGRGGPSPMARKQPCFFLCLFLGCLVQNFPGMRGGGGPTIYGGGVQMLISIEFDTTCDLPGMGVRTPYPPPPSGSAHA